MASSFLIRTDESQQAPQGAFGRPITAYFPQLRAYVAEYLGAETAGYFAEPVREAESGFTDWFTDAAGDPQPLSALRGPERREALAQLAEWRREMRAFAEAAPAENAGQIHKILSLALTDPSEDDVFVTGGRPVVVNWGFEPPRDFVPLTYPGTERRAPPQSEPPKDPETAGTERRLLGVSVLTLCMIGALCLAALTLFGKSAGLFDAPLVAAAEPDGSDPAELAELRRLQAANEALRRDVDGLQEDLLDRALACLGQCTAPPVPVDPTPPPGPNPESPPQGTPVDPPASPPADEPPADDPPPDEPPIVDPAPGDPPADEPPAGDPPLDEPPTDAPPPDDPPADEPPVDDPPVDEPPADEPPADDPPADDPPADPDPEGDPLVVPDGAEDVDDLSFLEGTWRSVAEQLFLTFSDSERPDLKIVVEYDIDASGEGTRRVLLEDGTICTGTVTASFDAQNRLQMVEGERADCGEGLFVVPYAVTCEIAQDRTADCTLTPRDAGDDASVKTELRRLQ
ncbi:hypothetical protein KU6B_39420 [Mameliella alba]|uniref:hypothetical protein n=1 Tax=Mameliella alba TaxID=561184 RepID=UPI0013E50F55|nr:hypothetical protein [Mameliella alba]BBU57677.1 hypothetical protein KU6B_39420 [Mameliella alba]